MLQQAISVTGFKKALKKREDDDDYYCCNYRKQNLLRRQIQFYLMSTSPRLPESAPSIYSSVFASCSNNIRTIINYSYQTCPLISVFAQQPSFCHFKRYLMKTSGSARSGFFTGPMSFLLAQLNHLMQNVQCTAGNQPYNA